MGLPVSHGAQPNADDGGDGDMTDLTRRVTVLEETVARMEPLLIRIDERLNHVATKSDLEAMRGSLRAEFEKGQADTRVQMEALRAETSQRIESLRADTTQQIESLRADTTQQIETLRADTTQQIESLRADMTQQIETLRADTTQQIESLRADTAQQIETLRGELRAGLAEKPGRFFMVGTVMTVFALCAAIVAATVAGLQYIQPVS
ncbi:hypothetical protein [uncultured Rhodospira sp.]|uniref:hypothetical protein n=1 Tax=uncultured Rhodospira sp. TaxID=1936189 RepID=UPI0026392D1E|nr:hypothetical protein [uncultured Rhodospira sp.]